MSDFSPDWVSAPADTMLEIMREKQISPADFMRGTGLNGTEFVGLVLGKLRISEELASKLEEVLGATAQFWINRDTHYVRDKKRLGLD